MGRSSWLRCRPASIFLPDPIGSFLRKFTFFGNAVDLGGDRRIDHFPFDDHASRSDMFRVQDEFRAYSWPLRSSTNRTLVVWFFLNRLDLCIDNVDRMSDELRMIWNDAIRLEIFPTHVPHDAPNGLSEEQCGSIVGEVDEHHQALDVDAFANLPDGDNPCF